MTFAFRTVLLATVLVASLAGAAGRAFAQANHADSRALGQHPAILVQRQAQQIDPNRFIVAHPARLAIIDTPTPTYAHPAVAVARMARDADTERFMSKTPVASAWLRHAEVSAAAGRAATAY